MPNLNRRAALSTAALALAAAPMVLQSRAFAQSNPEEYVKLTLEAGLFAMMSSELALEKGVTGATKTFAELEIGEQEAVKAVLTSTGVPAPTAIDGEEVVLMEKLKGLEGEAFEKAYLDGQLAGHEELLKIQRPMAGMEEITIPVATAKLAEKSILTHIEMLKMIQGQMA